MRVSVRKDDRGYHPEAKAFAFKILLDGTDMTMHCHTADEEEGRLYRYATNDFGEKYIDPVTDRPAEEVLYGRVEIIELVNGARSHA